MNLREKQTAIWEASMKLAMEQLKFIRDVFGEEYALEALDLAVKQGLVTSDSDRKLLEQYIKDPKYHTS